MGRATPCGVTSASARTRPARSAGPTSIVLLKVLRCEENAIQEADQDSVQETDHGRF